MKSSPWLLVTVLFIGWSGLDSALAQDGGLGLKQNLDLPLDAGGENSTDNDEDAPEVVIFYGQNLEGDAFFYVVDRSGSMQDRGELQRAKAEISRNISEFSPRTEFAIVFFDSEIKKFPPGGRPVPAEAAMKGAALAWIQNIPGGSGSCMMQGMREGLQYANLSSRKRKVICYVGDGGANCGGLAETVSVITAQNSQGSQINTIGVMMQGRGDAERYLKQLATSNNGTYRRIN